MALLIEQLGELYVVLETAQDRLGTVCWDAQNFESYLLRLLEDQFETLIELSL